MNCFCTLKDLAMIKLQNASNKILISFCTLKDLAMIKLV